MLRRFCNAFRIVPAVLSLGVCLAPRPVHAEDSAALDYDRFDIRLGGGWVFGANTTVSLIGSRGVGTVVDYNKTLDGDTSSSMYRIDGTWRMAPKHSLTYSWYDVNRNGTRTLDRQLDFGDQSYAVGALVSSKLDININRLLYRYSLARTESVNFEVGGGIYYGHIKMTLDAQGFAGPNTGSVHQTVTLGAPMPTAGVNVEANITPRIGTFVSADLFYFKVNDWEGAQTDTMLGLTYKLTKNLSLGAAYDRFALNLQGPVNHTNTFKVDNVWNTLFGFLSVHW